MGNQASKWSDFNKEEQVEACRQYAEDVKKMCDQFLERLNSGEIEEISEPCYEINRKFSTGTSYPNSEFSFQINFGVNGLTKKKKGSEFWPKDTIVADDEIDNGTLLTLNDGQEGDEVDGVPSQVASHSQEASKEASHSQEASILKKLLIPKTLLKKLLIPRTLLKSPRRLWSIQIEHNENYF